MNFSASYRQYTLWLIFGLLIIRIAALMLSPYDLHGDEAQYWVWAQNLDWGYFSKPPMIAWIISATTAIFGDAEWAARLASPILHSATAYLIFLTAQKAFHAKAGFWACAIYQLMPAVWVSSMIISTDVALLFFWALALHGWVSIRQDPSWRWAVQLGIAIGLGIMSKYAMLFFIPPLIIACLCDRPTRTALIGTKGLMAALISSVIVAPNIWWNSAHNFATLTHTASNTNLGGKTQFFHPIEFLQFSTDQLGVFGPIPFILLCIVIIGQMRELLRTKPPREPHDTFLLQLAVFCIVPLVVISVQALLSRANANWAVTAYPSAAVLLAGVIASPNAKAKWLRRGLIMQTLFCSFLLIVSLSPVLVDRIGMTNSVKRLLAWPQTVDQINTHFAQGHDGHAFEAIVMDNRLTFYGVNYYGLPKTAPIFMWQKHSAPHNHAELTQPFRQQGSAPILLINVSKNNVNALRRDFARLEPLNPITVNIGGGKTRKFMAWAAYGYAPKI
ncbi:MAG: glycosyltransferase family 39 protein [Litorimonas sp.]